MMQKVVTNIRKGTFTKKVKRKLTVTFQRLLRRFGLHTIRNADVAAKARQCNLYRRLEKEYRPILDASVPPPAAEQKRSNKVWVCWFQGFDSAPDIVKACMNSLRENLQGYEIVALDDSNLRDYIQLPDYIEEKRQRGVIPPAQYSDLIRTALLCRYGGLWIDATVLCTSARLMPVIAEAPLFAFKELHLSSQDESPTVASSWFIGAVSNHPILLLTQKLLYEYWKRESKLKDYFLFHLFFAMAARRYPEEWAAVPLFDNITPHILQFEIAHPYTEERWQQIEAFSPFHKLNRRVRLSGQGGTNYDFILRRYLNA